MLLVLIIISIVFLASLYLIFMMPRTDVQLADTHETISMPPEIQVEENQSKQLSQALADKTVQVETLQTDMEKINETLTKITQEKEARDKSVGELNTEIEKLKANLQEKDQKISTLNTDLEEINQALRKKDSDLKEKEESVSQLNSTIEEIRLEIDQKNNEITQKDERINKLDSDLDEANNLLKEKSAALTLNELKLDETDKQFKEELAKKEENISSLQEEVKKKEGLVDTFKSKRKTSSSRVSRLIKTLREGLKKTKAEAESLKQASSENERLKSEISSVTLDKETIAQKRDVIIVDLKKKFDDLQKKHIDSATQAKSEINFLNRELALKDKALEAAKTGTKKEPEAMDIIDGKIKGEYEKLRTEYNDLKDKSNWLVKLIREETEKKKNLEGQIEQLKEKAETIKHQEAVVRPSTTSSRDKEKEYFLRIYEEKLKTASFSDQNMPTDPETLKNLYSALKKHSQIIAKQLREAIDRTHELSAEISRLKNKEA